MAWTIATLIGSALSTVATTLLDYRYKDGRTKIFKRLRAALFAVTLGLLMVGIIAAVQANEQAQQEKAELRGQLTEMREAAAQEVKRAAERDAESQARLRSIQDSNQELSQRLEPFLTLARSRHGDLGEEAALAALSADLAKLSTRTTSIETNIAQRRVTEPVSQRMSAALSKVTGCRIIFAAPAGDQEAIQYAESVRQVFLSSGWRARGVTNVHSPQPMFDTILVSNMAVPPGTTCVTAALEALRLTRPDARMGPGKTHQPDDIEVTIGAKRAP